MQGPLDELELAQRLVAQAKAEGVSLTGPGGLLGELTERVLETALEGEMDEHVGYAKGDPAGTGTGNSRNGKRTKTVVTEIGPVDIDVPRTQAPLVLISCLIEGAIAGSANADRGVR
jgi:transposase-like protein